MQLSIRKLVLTFNLLSLFLIVFQVTSKEAKTRNQQGNLQVTAPLALSFCVQPRAHPFHGERSLHVKMGRGKNSDTCSNLDVRSLFQRISGAGLLLTLEEEEQWLLQEEPLFLKEERIRCVSRRNMRCTFSVLQKTGTGTAWLIFLA
ncbi:unnamed protein product [Lepidochelys kempii]